MHASVFGVCASVTAVFKSAGHDLAEQDYMPFDAKLFTVVDDGRLLMNDAEHPNGSYNVEWIAYDTGSKRLDLFGMDMDDLVKQFNSKMVYAELVRQDINWNISSTKLVKDSKFPSYVVHFHKPVPMRFVDGNGVTEEVCIRSMTLHGDAYPPVRSPAA